MKNIIEFIKDKSYYFLGGTVIIIFLIVIISSCSSKFNSGSYADIENKMTDAAKKYYSEKKGHLPKEEDTTVKVSLATLVDAELIDEIYDIKDSTNKCSGYVEVTKSGSDYIYVPFLTCKGNYEPVYLTEKIKSSKLDEYGNGVYESNGEYIYKGESVKNYVNFNDNIWRIVKIDGSGDIKMVLATRTEDFYAYDDSYNSDAQYNMGIVTNYLQTDIRKTLQKYYKDNFTKEKKLQIVSKNLCVGSYLSTDEFNTEKECLVVKENEKIGLLSASDYKAASLSDSCKTIESEECSNYNYLADDINIYTWLLNTVTDTSYKAFFLNEQILESYASDQRPINPVIFLSSKTLTVLGKGTKSNPYIIK